MEFPRKAILALNCEDRQKIRYAYRRTKGQYARISLTSLREQKTFFVFHFLSSTALVGIFVELYACLFLCIEMCSKELKRHGKN